MTMLRIALLAILGGPGCVTTLDTSEVSSDDRTLTDEGTFAASEEGADICTVLPSCGLCSHICDGTLADYVPAGVCAAIRCELTDGRTVTVHACH